MMHLLSSENALSSYTITSCHITQHCFIPRDLRCDIMQHDRTVHSPVRSDAAANHDVGVHYSRLHTLRSIAAQRQIFGKTNDGLLMVCMYLYSFVRTYVCIDPYDASIHMHTTIKISIYLSAYLQCSNSTVQYSRAVSSASKRHLRKPSTALCCAVLS